MNKHNNLGFTVIEGLLLVVIVGLVGFTGWYVWNSKNKTDNLYDNSTSSDIPKYTSIKTFEDCKKSADSKIQESFPEVCVTASGKKFTAPATTKYFTIKEWGVQAPYSGKLTLSYVMDGSIARFSAKEMDDIVSGSDISCKGFAGAIGRYAPTDMTNDESQTVSNAAKTNSSYIHLGAYYYLFAHAQAFCSGSLPATISKDKQEKLTSLLTQSNDEVKAIVAKLQIVQ